MFCPIAMSLPMPTGGSSTAPKTCACASMPTWTTISSAAPAVKKVLLDYTERECFGYSPAPGAVGLGDAVADFHESRYDWRPDPKKVFWIGDVVRGLLLGIQYFTRPDSPVVVPLPA